MSGPFLTEYIVMASRENFSPDEWPLVLGGVIVTGMAVTLADPSGLIGMTKEWVASGNALVEAKADPNANALIKSIAAELGTSEGRAAVKSVIQRILAGKSASEIKGSLLAALAESAALVESKAPDDAAGYKAWLGQISERVAGAASEGGFLGFGGVQVSETEKATLEEISKALKLKA
jgi:hypothetical protein